MGERINQYGWTPERIWGVVAVIVALTYGAAAWWALFKGRQDFDEQLRPLQTKLAIGLCGIALFLALPILDFGAISAKSQQARLEGGKVKAHEFDWAAMAFDFGPAGRRALERIARTGSADRRELASAALKSDNRYWTSIEAETALQARTLEQRLRLLSPDIELSPALRRHLTAPGGCGVERCALLRIDADRLLVLSQYGDQTVHSTVIHLSEIKDEQGSPGPLTVLEPEPAPKVEDFQSAPIELRTITRRQAFIDGKPVGETFE